MSRDNTRSLPNDESVYPPLATGYERKRNGAREGMIHNVGIQNISKEIGLLITNTIQGKEPKSKLVIESEIRGISISSNFKPLLYLLNFIEKHQNQPNNYLFQPNFIN